MEMQFDEEVSIQLALIDKCLKFYGQNSVFTNGNFEVVRPFGDVEHYLEIRHIHDGLLNIRFILNTYGFRIDVDKAEEIIDVTHEQFLKQMNLIEQFIVDLLSCQITITYIGSGITNIAFFRNGKRVRRLRYFEGLFFFLPLSFKRIKYQAIYTLHNEDSRQKFG